ncbi:MAG: ATP-binding protein, partial [Oscillospiraceae bacterium]
KDRFQRAKEETGTLVRIMSETGSRVSEDDLDSAESLERDIDSFLRMLGGLSLTADINLENGHEARISSVSDGSEIELKDGKADIREAFRVDVPGVMSMTVMPKDADSGEAREKLESDRKALKEILSRYSVSDARELRGIYRHQQESQREADSCMLRLKSVLSEDDKAEISEKAGDESPEDLLRDSADAEKAQALDKAVSGILSGIPECREISEVEADIDSVTGGMSSQAFIGRSEALIKEMEEQYSSVDELKKKITDTESELKKIKAQIETDRSIPEEYLRVSDPEAHKKELKEAADRKKDELNESAQAFYSCKAGLPDRSSEEYNQDIAEAESGLEEAKQHCRRLMHIMDVFKQLKSESVSNPFSDIEKSFRKYLEAVSSGHDTVSEMDEKGNASIQSRGNILTYELISEGTRDTISLAFRLAVLDHLFPDGGGLAVFDDPFTDMDAGRRKQACRILREFADHGNQVIFMTCTEGYENELGGNVIRDLTEN